MHWKGCTAEQSSQTVWINSFKIHGQETVNKTMSAKQSNDEKM